MRRGFLRTPARPFSLRPPQVIVAGFAAAVLLGVALLSIPAATEGPGGAPFTTAAFTAVSAVTVTGLVAVDTATYWSPFGQAVIIGLVQLGGLGIVTSASILILVVSRRVGLRGRLRAQAEVRTSGDLASLRRLTAFIVAFTFAVEAAVVAALTLRLWLGYDRSFGRALWEGIFNGVGAFNQAGFSLYSDNLIGFATDALILVPIALAVIIGGVGFPVWLELRRRPRTPSRWTLHTKLTLVTTFALLVIGFIMLTGLEWGNPDTLGGENPAGKLLGGFFAAVTARSAGFNTVDYADMGTDSLLVTDLLMFVGGGSASPAGGIKVTTFAILLLIVWAELRSEREVAAFERAIPATTLRQALTVAVIAINAVVIATLILVASNDLGLSSGLFESVSAFSTTGLSTGVTGDLDTLGQAILMVLMFLGRVGPITLGVALVLRERERRFSHPEERPIVG
ncbi:MAG TPA: potassium transporter TrkG [Miltoncostaeaceae bacterium]|nr:potassium transporter TrkG [Miltoncostaeaceae bacterium]